MKHKIDEFREIRRAYIDDCRKEYGFTARSHTKTIGSSHAAGFVSAMFGCALMVAVLATIDFHTLSLALDRLYDFSITGALSAIFEPMRGIWIPEW